MAVPSSITDLSTTASSNSPSGSENPKEGDNHLRTAYAFIRTLYNWLTDGLSAITCAALTAKGNVVLGDAAGDTLNVAAGAIAVDASGDVTMSGNLAVTGTASAGGSELGYRGVPPISTGATTATTGVRGRVYLATGDITIPDGVFAAGDTFSIMHNASSGTITVVQGSGFSLFLAGTDSSGNRTLGPFGLATVLVTNPSGGVISGAGLS